MLLRSRRGSVRWLTDTRCVAAHAECVEISIKSANDYSKKCSAGHRRRCNVCSNAYDMHVEC